MRGTAMRLLGAAVAVAVLGAVTAAPAAAASGTVAIGVAPEAVRMSPTPIVLSGSIDVPGSLHARAAYSWDCPETPDSATGDLLLPLDGQPIEPGPFSVQVSPVLGTGNPDSTSQLLCVWLTRRDWGSAIVGAASTTVRLRAARGDVRVSAPTLERGVPATVTVSGSVDAARRLDVVRAGYCGTDEEDGEGAAGEHSAAHDDLARLTPADGVMVGPGPFSIPLPWTPEIGSGQHVICAYLSPPGRLAFPDFATSFLVEWALPKVSALAPADGAAGPLLNPRFSWQSSGSRRHPVRSDTVELWRVEGERRIPLARIGPARWQALSGHVRTYLGVDGSGPTRGIASVRGASFQLRDGLWPGTYEWRVTRSRHQPSPTRRFTVEARPLRRVEIGWRWARVENVEQHALELAVRTVPFSTLRREWRVNGGRWRALQWQTRRSAVTQDRIATSCARPGGQVFWRLSATDALGTVRLRHGRFPNMNAAQCAHMHRNRAFDRRYERACRSIGGRPVKNARNFWRCITPPGTPRQRLPGF